MSLIDIAGSISSDDILYEGIQVRDFNRLLKYLQCKIMGCKRIEDRRWISLPIKFRCALVLKYEIGLILNRTFNIEDAEVVCESLTEELTDEGCVKEAALLVDCYDFKSRSVARIIISITGDYRKVNGVLVKHTRLKTEVVSDCMVISYDGSLYKDKEIVVDLERLHTSDEFLFMVDGGSEPN